MNSIEYIRIAKKFKSNFRITYKIQIIYIFCKRVIANRWNISNNRTLYMGNDVLSMLLGKSGQKLSSEWIRKACLTINTQTLSPICDVRNNTALREQSAVANLLFADSEALSRRTTIRFVIKIRGGNFRRCASRIRCERKFFFRKCVFENFNFRIRNCKIESNV